MAAAAICSTARAERQDRFDAGELPDFPAETARHPRRRLDGRRDPARPARPPGRDHRADQRQDADQRAQQRRAGLHGRFRGRDLAGLGRAGPGPGQPPRLLARPARLHRSGQRQALCGGRQSRGADGAPARLAPARGPCDRDGEAVAGGAVRFRALSLAQRPSGARGRARARISTSPSSRAATRRRCGATSSPSPRTSSGSSAARSRRRC